MAGDFRKACFLHEYDVCAYCDITSSFSLVFVYGGVQMRDLIAMISVLLVVALEICSLSILCSAGANRSVYAALSAYASNLILIGGTLFVHLAPSLLYSSSVYGDQLGSPVSWYHYLLLTNPVVTFMVY